MEDEFHVAHRDARDGCQHGAPHIVHAHRSDSSEPCSIVQDALVQNVSSRRILSRLGLFQA